MWRADVFFDVCLVDFHIGEVLRQQQLLARKRCSNITKWNEEVNDYIKEPAIGADRVEQEIKVSFVLQSLFEFKRK